MGFDYYELIDRLAEKQNLTDEEFLAVFDFLNAKNREAEYESYLYQKADAVRRRTYGTEIFVRGLIEFTNYCKNDCYYCGIRRGNRCAERYRLTFEEVLECCELGYNLGFQTFVLQGGEDPHYTDEQICSLVKEIKNRFPDCAVTLSIGEKEKESYQAFFDAGADRYLLRHETADPDYYRLLHPEELSLEHRKQCLRDLREIGYQVGCGMMIGAPYQTGEHILADLRFMQELKPHMIGTGPFIPHKDTPFAKEQAGTLKDTIHLLAILRLLFPHVLLPATTALGTIHPLGREMGIQAGANVVMLNLSPASVREKYMLYDGKLCTGDETAQERRHLEERMQKIGYQVVTARGDYRTEFR